MITSKFSGVSLKCCFRAQMKEALNTTPVQSFTVKYSRIGCHTSNQFSQIVSGNLNRKELIFLAALTVLTTYLGGLDSLYLRRLHIRTIAGLQRLFLSFVYRGTWRDQSSNNRSNLRHWLAALRHDLELLQIIAPGLQVKSGFLYLPRSKFQAIPPSQIWLKSE